MFRRAAFIKVVFSALLLGVLIFYSASSPVAKIREISFFFLKPMIWAAGMGKNILGLSGTGVFPEDMVSVFRFEIEKLKEENESLKKALRFKDDTGVTLRGADVLLYSVDIGKEYMIVNQGNDAGVKEGDFVVDELGVLLGRVFEVGVDYSKVSLASNAGEVFEAEILPQGIVTVVRGLGGRSFALDLVGADEPVRAGDFVVLRRAGLPKLLLGQVASVDKGGASAFKRVGASSLFHPEKLGKVFILVP